MVRTTIPRSATILSRPFKPLALAFTLAISLPLAGCESGEVEPPQAFAPQPSSLEVEGILLHEEQVGEVRVAFYETPSGLMSVSHSPLERSGLSQRIAESLRQATLTESFDALREVVGGSTEMPEALRSAQERYPFVPVAYDEQSLKTAREDALGAATLEAPLRGVEERRTLSLDGKVATLQQGLTTAEDDAWIKTWLCSSTQTCKVGFGSLYSGWIQSKSSYRVHMFNSSNDTPASYGSRYRISSRQNWVVGMSGRLAPRYQVEATYYAVVGNIARDSWISGWEPFPITPTSSSVTFDQSKPLGPSMRVNMAQSWAEPTLKAFVGGSKQLHGFCVNQDVPTAFHNLPLNPSGKVRYRSAAGSQLAPFNATLYPFGECGSFSGAWDNHIQGVGRLRTNNNDNRWFVMSRSRPGHVGGAGLFLAQFADSAIGNPEGRLVAPGASYTGDPPSYRRTWYYYPMPGTDHPGGFQVVGGLLAIASEGAGNAAGFVDFYDLRDPGAENAWFQRFTLDGTHGEPTGSANTKPSGAGLTKLANGLYLLFVLNKDDQYSGEFYLSNTSTLSNSTWWQWLSRVTWSGRKYQNANFINDCSGNLYLGMTNNERFDADCGFPQGCSVFSGQNTADVFSVSFQPGTFNTKLTLVAQRVFGQDDDGYNQFRAAANFIVGRDNKLLLYSHAHHANTDPIGCPDSKLKLSEFAN